jgi:hypothetical protein
MESTISNNETKEKRIINHFKILSTWAIICLLIFRLDELLLTTIYSKIEWARYIFIGILIIMLLGLIKFNKWYFSLLVIIYPFIIIFWSLPKQIFLKGKIYLLFEYINYLFGKIINWRKTLFEITLGIITLFIIIFDNSNFKLYLILIFSTYKFWPFLFRNIFRNFKKTSEIDISTVEVIEKYKSNKSFEKSLAKAYIIQKEDESLEITIRNEKQKKRTILALYAIRTFEEKIKDFKTTHAFTYLWLFKIIFIFAFSIVYFWMLNYFLFLIHPDSFIYKGQIPAFDFLYYTFKTITFGDIELVIPNSVFSRSIEIISFLIFGIAILTYLLTFIISFKQESLKQKLHYSTELCKVEAEIVENYLTNELKSDFETGLREYENIQDSLRKIKDIINRIF